MDQTLTLPRSGTDVPTPAGPAPGLLVRLGLDTAYVVAGLVLGVLGFAVVVTGLSAGAGLVVVWVGLAVLAGTLLLARGLAHVQRRLMVTLLRRDVPAPTYAAAPPGSGTLRRGLTPLRDPQSWLDALWALVSLVLGTAAFVVVTAWWTAVLSGTTYWFWQQWLPEQDETLVEVLGWGGGRGAESLLQLGLGLVALVTLPWVVRGCATVHAGVADVLLNLRARG